MDVDLDVISEEEVYSDPLFSTIKNAINSMKEATADKIYQKIQREGPSNYSKPQVDRALASALRYGIFEGKNNQYRVRDDALDDVDTVYWKMQRKREQTPFRLQEDIDERQYGPKLDPEKDNLRFQKIADPDATECPQCGRTKRPSQEKKDENSDNTIIRSKEKSQTKEMSKSYKKRKRRQKEQFIAEEPLEHLNKNEGKRNYRCDTFSDDSYSSFGRMQGDNIKFPGSSFPGKKFRGSSKNNSNFERNFGQKKYDTSDESEFDSVSFISDEDDSSASYKDHMNTAIKKQKSRFDSEYEEIEAPKFGDTNDRSNISIKSDSDSDRSDLSYFSDNKSKSKLNGLFFENPPSTSASTGHNRPFQYKRYDAQSQSKSKLNELFFENPPCTSSNTGNNNRTHQYKRYNEDCEVGKFDPCKRQSYWTGYPEDSQGAITQTNNVLKIEPIDFLGFKGPEHTSYIL